MQSSKGRVLLFALLSLSIVHLIVIVACFSIASRWAQLIVSIPGYLLVVLGCYSLASVGFGVATFPECPSALEGLRADIAWAKKDLESRKRRIG